MDATLTETAPATQRSDSAPIGPHWVRWTIVATIAVGLAWRFVRYFEQFPIWGDEAMLLLNILDRDYLGLTEHLRYAQVAPLLFLWLEKSALLLFGPAEWSVHLFPFVAGLGAFAIYWHTCRTHFAPAVAGFAICILVVAYYPIRHACEVKPYAFDLFYSVAFASLTLAYLRDRQSRWLIALTCVAPIAVFSSYPSVFVAGAVSLVLLPRMREAAWSKRGWYVAFNIVLLGSFLVHYGLIGHQQADPEEAQRVREFLRNYWKDAFPPDNFVLWPIWLLKVFTGNMLAYPMGAKNGGSIATFVWVLIGSWSLWRSGRRSLLALCWLPFGLNLIAAILNKYPFGDSARITLHLAPFICILMAHGIAQTLDWIANPVARARLHLSLHAILLGLGVLGVVRDLRTPFKTVHDREVRQLAHDIGKQVAPGEPIVIEHPRDEDLLAEFLWYLRTQSLELRWQPDRIDESTASYWRIQCSNQPPGPAEPTAGWAITQSEVRLVPPENDKMAPMYCRWVRMVRR
ncbi:MAG: glycosyltransferase family 39 protein [Planctomycetes bacterium]|nr:glycosyltransferase family 39 protein [Planctomycetota bacterium]